MNTKTKHLFFFSLLVPALLLPAMVNSQSQDLRQLPMARELRNDTHIRSFQMAKDRQTPVSIELDRDQPAAYQDKDIPELLQRFLALRPGRDELRLFKREHHLDDINFKRYQQYFRNVKVEHGQYVALSKGMQPSNLSGAFYAIDEQLRTTPTLTEDQALALAMKSIGAQQYLWEYIDQYRNGINAPDIAAELNKAYTEHYPVAELVIVDDYNTEELDLDLAYKFNIYAAQPLSRDYVYVNAHDGRIMLKDAIIKHASADVQTRYSGIQTIGTTQVTEINLNPPYIGSTQHFVLWDQERGNGIRTYDMNTLGGLPLSVPLLYEGAVDFADDDNNWTLEEHVLDPTPTIEEALNDDIAWDAHWGAGVVYDYWKDRHNRLSYDGQDAAINSYVHYGEGYDNAFWNGTAMTYGDGSYKNTGVTEVAGFSPLTSMDVCAHEIGHGVCEFTANLVYQRESGAMNEGFSDIWAAAIEAYVIDRYSNQSFDYNPWGIGEQIDQRDGFGNLDKALRWMDDPKRAGDPDTYGGDNWSNPDCGEPTLVNDYCGVHTNSGVLNKWFYLLTAGSGQSPDDGINDLGNAYSVTGLGFAKSELIAFGTEVQLTPNATFAEARAAGIAYARAVYGPCSNEEMSVTNAWYAVGVGPAFACSNEVNNGFLVTQRTVNESVTEESGCGIGKVIGIDLFVNGANSFTLEVGGTATAGSDYILSSADILSTGTGFSTKTIEVTILDDASHEGDETITLTIPAGNGSAPGSDVYTLTIRDDDVSPIVGIGPKSLLYERFLTTSLPDGWAIVENISGMNEWYFGSYQGSAYISFTGEVPNYEGENSPTDLILRSPLIDARGLTDLILTFDWTAGGETDLALGGGAPFDFANVVYSFDGTKFYDMDDVMVGDNFGTTPTSGAFEKDLTALLGNQEFYLGWRWRNDPLIGTLFSFSMDNIRLNGTTRQVESDLEQSAEAPLGPFETAYFYSLEDGELLATITNLENHDYGCTSIAIERAGNGTASWLSGSTATEKAIRFNPEHSSSSKDLELTLYYDETELAGWESGSGMDRSQLQLYRTRASDIESANSGNTNTATTTYTPILKSGSTMIAGSFTATFSGRAGSLVLAADGAGSNRINNLPRVATRSDEDWKIFPNPAKGFTNIQLPYLEDEQDIAVRVLDLRGQVLSSRVVDGTSGSYRLNVSDLPAGVYWLRIQTDDQQLTKKLIIQ